MAYKRVHSTNMLWTTMSIFSREGDFTIINLFIFRNYYLISLNYYLNIYLFLFPKGKVAGWSPFAIPLTAF